MRTDSPKKEILVRLKRIEGQMRGIQQMVENDLPCAGYSDPGGCRYRRYEESGQDHGPNLHVGMSRKEPERIRDEEDRGLKRS